MPDSTERLTAALEGRYRVLRRLGEGGMALVYLASEVLADLDVVTVSRPVIQRLAETTRQTVNLGVLHDDAVVCVEQATGSASGTSVSWIGRRTPLNCTSNGKVLLAAMDEARLDRALAESLQKCTDRSIVDAGALREELDRCRKRGYASTVEELEAGLNAVAAPVRRGDGQVVAALSIAGPASQLRPIDLPRIGQEAISAAEAISRRLGYRERA